MLKSIGSRFVITSFVWSIVALACAAADQEQPDQNSQSSVERAFEEITVTAQKRDQSIETVPLTVTAIAGEDLVRRGISNAQDLSFAVPGLSVFDTGGGRQDISIRGIDSIRGTSSLTGVYLDEIPVTGAQDGFTPSYLDVRALDLQRVEVLKGPQGTLFGEGAVGGVIRYVTNDPDLAKFGGQMTVNGFATRDGDPSEAIVAILNTPLLRDELGIRVVATYENNGGWIDQPTAGRTDINSNALWDIRLKALWQPTSRLSITSLIDVHRNKGNASNVVNVPPFSQSLFQQAFDIHAPTNYKDSYEIYNLTATYDLGFANLLSSTSYYTTRSDAAFTQLLYDMPVPLTEILFPDYRKGSTTASQELRLASSGDGALKWVAGVNVKRSGITSDYVDGFDAYLFSKTVTLTADELGLHDFEHSRAWAGFGDASYTFDSRLEIGGGLRYFSDDRSSSDTTGAHEAGVFSKWTYRAYVRFSASDNINLYANTASGFRSGGFNSQALAARGANPSYGPETSVFYEAGMKSFFLNGRMGFDIALYQGKYSDQLQDTFATSPVDGGLLLYTVNAGVAVIKGVEVLLNVSPVENLTLSAGGDWIDTKYTTVSAAAPVLVGDPISDTPQYTAVISAAYSFRWTQTTPGRLDVGFNSKGKAYAIDRVSGGIDKPVDQSSPTYFLQASLEAGIDGFQFRLFGRNLLDERHPLNPASADVGVYSQARPRSVGISVSTTF